MKLEIIAELHPQHGGSLANMRELIRTAALEGATVAKFQLYDARALLGSERWSYLELTQDDIHRLQGWCEQDELEFSASVFDKTRLHWCEELGVRRYKIASRTVSQDPSLCAAVLATGKPVIVSLGAWVGPGLPFGVHDQISYLYCKSAYPAFLEDLADFPTDFPAAGLRGYSDHTLGIGACLLAIARGASIIEKHMTLSKALSKDTEKAHICSMTAGELRELRRIGNDLLRTRAAIERA